MSEQGIGIRLTLNGELILAHVRQEDRLLDFLRYECGLTGTKEGCGEGECGACTVLLDGVLTRGQVNAMTILDQVQNVLELTVQLSSSLLQAATASFQTRELLQFNFRKINIGHVIFHL